MTKKAREQAARSLLEARGWLSCWLPLGMKVPDTCVLNGVRAGNLKGAIGKIDEVLKSLGHVANGRVK